MKSHVLWRPVLVGLCASMVALAGCSDDEPEEPVEACSVQNGTGCPAGQECMIGADGKPACFCSVNGQTGCEEGLECQLVEGGWAECFCSVDGQTGCEDGLVCETVQNGNSACFPPVSLKGMVFDIATDAAIAGAHVVARDANNVAVSDVAVTDANGNYELVVPTPRQQDGTLLQYEVMLRADAAGYLSFPKPPRVALPIDVSEASGDPPTLQTSATDIGLIELPDASNLGAIAGAVLAAAPRGTLVVAGGATSSGGAATGIADFDGNYTVFNVPAGSVSVKGYKVGLQLDGNTAQVNAGQTTEGVNLADLGEATAVVQGKVEIVNPGSGNATSIILAVDETFNDQIASGEAPPGLRAGDITGAWSIAGVPNGNYVVLAAFENDFLVRDPDQSIGGTKIVRVTVAGADVELAESFKITGSLDDVSPDGEEVVSGTPTFEFSDDSGEDHYEIVVFDALGNLVWEKLDVPGVSGSHIVTVPYEGPALQSGLLYQFRATSIKLSGSPISRTEDLRGVFLFQ